MIRFNVDKCCVMFVGCDRMEFSGQVDYFLNKRIIKEVTELQYLAITLNKNLKWEGHIHAIINRAMRILGLLKSTLYHANIKTKLIAYKTLCRLLLEYSSAAWDPYLIKNIDSLKNGAKQSSSFYSRSEEVL